MEATADPVCKFAGNHANYVFLCSMAAPICVMHRPFALRMRPVPLALLSAANVGDFNNRRLAVLPLPIPHPVDLDPHNLNAIKNVQSQSGIRVSLKHLE